MNVFHLQWVIAKQNGISDGLFIWAEHSEGDQPKRDGRKKKAAPHNYQLPVADLYHNLQITPHAAQATTHIVQLPTNKFGPIPSPELVQNWERDPHPPQWHPWQVSGLLLPPKAAFALFTSHLHKVEDARAKMGSDSQFWTHVFRYTLYLLSQQRIRPTLVQIPDPSSYRYESRWLPILDSEEDGARLGRLAQSMPPACRALTDTLADAAPPQQLIDNFLNHMVDQGVRHWAQSGRERFLPTQNDPPSVWLRALFDHKARIKASTGQMQHFYSSFHAWERTMQVAGNKQFRVTFRLQAPAVQKTPSKNVGQKKQVWQLHYLLQARDDTAVLLPAAEVWQQNSGVVEALGHRFDRPHERLLTGLGYAGKLFPPIQTGLKQKSPTHVSLTTEEAYTFLRQCVPQLIQSGFGVLTPPWWNKPGARLGVKLKLSKAKMKGGQNISKNLVGFDNLIDYKWDLSLGDETLSQQEFDALVALKSPLLQIRGQWVQLDAEQIEKAIQFWQKQSELEGSLPLMEGLRLGLDEASEAHGLPVEDVMFDAEFKQWLDQVQHDETLTLIDPPQSLQATLRPYQNYGYSWLHFTNRWRMGVILADDMGLGKTIQTLTFLQQLQDQQGGRLTRPVLLICPTSVVTNWDIERRKFTPKLTTLVHQGSDRLKGEALLEAVHNVDIVLTSFALVRRDVATLGEVNWQGVILDEAQNIKNAQTKQAQIIRQLSADFRLALTGTPVENRLSELWSIMQFLNPGYLGSQKGFRKSFILPIEKENDSISIDRLRRLIRPFILRRVKTDPTVISDLPDKQELKVYCPLTAEQATLYEAVVRQSIQAIEEETEGGIKRKWIVLSMLTQLKQICNHPAQYLHQKDSYNPFEDNGRSGKLDRLNDLLDEILASDDRILIFSQFTEMAGLLQRYIQNRLGAKTLYLHGGVKPKARAEMVDRFQNDPTGPPIFLLSLKAGGTGLNLTRANHVFHFDRWWNPAVENQATDRAFRIGQTKNVLVHKFVCTGTLEERIDQMIDGKKALAEQVIGSGEGWLTELSTADIRDLVQLRG